ncbi:PREDICTED: myocyte-specific enhancer factor 2A-like [Cyprinodon variegatus]|uniref:myocyte-specific enhancer factor 2A-like n=1 Tax=Cyprinodon variegatus TaxID=28743 RepID=UPI000742AC07|nr:PREDICTED: myocyte-specific enhancer factor 2A-like [Cyprinodon variegatus]
MGVIYTPKLQLGSSRVKFQQQQRLSKALNKKEHRGCDSPDNESTYVLTPSTEEKYKKINEDFDNMMKSHKISTGQPQQHFMQAALGSSNYCHGAAGGGGGVTSQVLSDNGILCSPHTHPQRHTNSSQRPPSTGNSGGLQASSDLALHNGSGAAVNGFMGSSDGSSILGKIGPTKSPPSLPHQGSSLIPSSRKTDLRVVIPHCKGMMLLGGGVSANRVSVIDLLQPSLTAAGLVFIILSLCWADYSLSSADMAGFSSAAGLGSMTAWEQHQLSSLGSAGSNLSVHTNINIKAEPISPPRDHLTQPGYLTHLAAPPPPPPPSASSSTRADLGRSPTGSVSSSCSSHEDGSDREEHQQRRRPDLLLLPAGRSEGRESPTVKRMRMDSWVT